MRAVNLGMLTSVGVPVTIDYSKGKFTTSKGTFNISDYETITMYFQYQDKEIVVTPDFAEKLLDRNFIAESEFKITYNFGTPIAYDAKFTGYVANY